MLGAHRLIGLAHIDRVVAVERGLQGVERRAPLLVAREQVGEHGERRGLRVRRRRTQIGGIGRGRAAGDEFVAVVRLGVVGRGRDPGVSQPVGGVLGRGGDRCAGELLGGGEVAAGDGLGGFGQQLLRRLAFDLAADRRRGDAQGLRQPHGVARHVLARERLGLGGAGASRKQDQKDGERAQSVKHGQTFKRLAMASQPAESSTVEAALTKTNSEDCPDGGAEAGGGGSVRKPHRKGQRRVEAAEVAFVEATDRLAYPRSANRHGLVRHDLGSRSQAIVLARLDRDAKIGRLDQFGGQLTDHDRGAGSRGSASVWTITAGRGLP